MDTMPTNVIGLGLMTRAMDAVRPEVTLQFHQHAIIMQKRGADGSITEYPVDPKDLAQIFASEHTFNTGLIGPDVLNITEGGTTRTVIAYRKPQITGLWLDGQEDPLQIPLPGLIMRRTTYSGKNPDYAIWAVKRRPMSEDNLLYYPPIPNVRRNGSCWGTVRKPEALHETDLSEDWDAFFGSRFGNHYCNDKSKTYPKDVRLMYSKLRIRTKYPLDDLVSTGHTMGEVLSWA